MTGDPLDETWEAWTARLAADLEALTEDDWLTLAVRVVSPAPSTDADGQGSRGWRRVRPRPARPGRVPDVFVQARRIEGVLALECIGDTEFEGLTDLTPDQQAALAGLGWDRDGPEPEFSRTFEDASAAAQLVRDTLDGVLGAGSPTDVDERRAPRP